LVLCDSIKFSMQAAVNSTSTQCSHWYQPLDEGYGGWSTKGCSLVEETREEAICECRHLGTFAITVVCWLIKSLGRKMTRYWWANFACVVISKDLRFAASIQESGGLNYTRESGQNISFACTASSSPLPDITWLRNGYPIQAGLSNKFQVSEQTFTEFYNPFAGTKQSIMVVSDLGIRAVHNLRGSIVPQMYCVISITSL